MRIQPATPEAYQLFQRGAITLARIEENGIRIDTGYLGSKLEETASEIKRIEQELQQDKIWKVWKKRYGDKTNLYSRPQLGNVLFNILGHKPKGETATKRHKVDESVLQSLELPFTDNYLKAMKLANARTKLLGIERETCEGYLHPFYNLTGSLKDDTKGGARSYRGSSDSPNFQNYNIRDKFLGELIRRSFIPRKRKKKRGRLIEIDFGGIEVKIAYCYHKDPTMKQYLLDKSKDMHRDMAIECYKLQGLDIPKEWWKDKEQGQGADVRYCGKNQFVFPQFYGDDWFDCSRQLWESIDKLKLKAPDGSSLKDHLKSRGIKRLGDQDREERNPPRGTLEHHIKEVQDDFWGRRFKVYGQWRKDWFELYRERCWFPLKTGFVCSGLYRKNQVINYPVQGAAFHCLLWVLIEMQKWLEEKRLKTKIVGQIHDSILLDAPEDEVEIVVHKMLKLMTKDIREAWPWIIIPLEVEVDTTSTNWYEKKPYDLAT